MNNKKRKAAKVFLLAVIAVCLFQIGRLSFQSRQQAAKQEKLKAMAAEEITPEEITPKEMASNLTVKEARDTKEQNRPSLKTPVMLEKYAGLYAENNDLAGWLSIPGMQIDYPIMQTDDDAYYLHHDFYGKESRYGCLYVRGMADLDAGDNFIIYGHNMKDGAMFGDLDLYAQESFYAEHSVISFDTLYEERLYDIIAVFYSQVYDAKEDVFQYYQFYEADTQEEFDDFYQNIKELSLYETGVDAQFGDTFLTLSTCAYHVKDGRFAVVAKRRRMQ